MSSNDRWSRALWIIPLLLAATLACALPGQSSGGGAPPLPTGGGGASTSGGGAASPTATSAPAATSGEGAPLDLCAFATPDEVTAVLGGPAKHAVWFAAGQDCTLSVDNNKVLIVQAGHAADGKTLHIGGMEGVRSKVTDPAMLQLLDQIKQQQDTLTLAQLVEKGLPYWRAAGYDAAIEPGLGDGAAWFWGEQGGFKLGEIGTWRVNGKWVGVYTNAVDDKAASKALLKPLAAALLDRLPDNFTVAGNGY